MLVNDRLLLSCCLDYGGYEDEEGYGNGSGGRSGGGPRGGKGTDNNYI